MSGETQGASGQGSGLSTYRSALTNPGGSRVARAEATPGGGGWYQHLDPHLGRSSWGSSSGTKPLCPRQTINMLEGQVRETQSQLTQGPLHMMGSINIHVDLYKLILEQHGLELHGSAYVQIYKTINIFSLPVTFLHFFSLVLL